MRLSTLLLVGGAGVTLAAAFTAGGVMRDAGRQAPQAETAAVVQASAIAQAAPSIERVSVQPVLRGSLSEAARPAPLRPAFAAVKPAQPFQARGPVAGSTDLECLTQAVYYEARGETPLGQAAVAQVVLNRVRHPSFPKTVCGVVYQGVKSRGCQFSFACGGQVSRHPETEAWRRAQKVASQALAGVVIAQVGNATHFHTLNVNPRWGDNLLRVAQVGLHVFYRTSRTGAPRPAAVEAEPQPLVEPLVQFTAAVAPEGLTRAALTLAPVEPVPAAEAAAPSVAAEGKPAAAVIPVSTPGGAT